VRLREILNLFRASAEGLNPNEVPVQAAALAFYTLLSLAPLVTITVAISGLVFDQAAVESQILTMATDIIGEPAANLLQSIFKINAEPTTGGILAAISFVFLLFAASTMFWQLRVSLNTVWGLRPEATDVRQNYLVTLMDRLLALVTVLVVGFLLLGALLLSALATAISLIPVQALLANFQWLAWLLSLVVSPVIYLLIFAAIFKFLPRSNVRWRDLWPGAAVTAVLFWLGGYLIWLYLARSGVASIYGAAGSLIVFLLWVYASAWIFLFGAKFTQVYANTYGIPIEPAEPIRLMRRLARRVDRILKSEEGENH
jgi:membrane protein